MSDPTNNRIIIAPQVILQLFHYAEEVGMCNHKLCDMIKKGSTEKECLDVLNKLLQQEMNDFKEIPF